MVAVEAGEYLCVKRFVSECERVCTVFGETLHENMKDLAISLLESGRRGTLQSSLAERGILILSTVPNCGRPSMCQTHVKRVSYTISNVCQAAVDHVWDRWGEHASDMYEHRYGT